MRLKQKYRSLDNDKEIGHVRAWRQTNIKFILKYAAIIPTTSAILYALYTVHTRARPSTKGINQGSK